MIKYQVGSTVGTSELIKAESRRTPCPPRNNGKRPDGTRATCYYQYRVWWNVRCVHGYRWIRQDTLPQNSGGCLKCAGAATKVRGLPWNTKPFYKLIFQPRICKDCEVSFETLYPTQERCKSCQTEWKHAVRHYGSKCKKYEVPFEKDINATAVFRRNNWICWLCGKLAPKELRGTYDDLAPELEHKIELSVLGSPGHVGSNVALAHRKCNRNKEIQRIKNKA